MRRWTSVVYVQPFWRRSDYAQMDLRGIRSSKGAAEFTQHSPELGIDPLPRRSGLRGPARTTAGAGRSPRPNAARHLRWAQMRK
jgi:hypothetical protein